MWSLLQECKQALAFSFKSMKLLLICVVTKIQNWLRFLWEPGFLIQVVLVSSHLQAVPAVAVCVFLKGAYAHTHTHSAHDQIQKSI